MHCVGKVMLIYLEIKYKSNIFTQPDKPSRFIQFNSPETETSWHCSWYESLLIRITDRLDLGAFLKINRNGQREFGRKKKTKTTKWLYLAVLAAVFGKCCSCLHDARWQVESLAVLWLCAWCCRDGQLKTGVNLIMCCSQCAFTASCSMLVISCYSICKGSSGIIKKKKSFCDISFCNKQEETPSLSPTAWFKCYPF